VGLPTTTAATDAMRLEFPWLPWFRREVSLAILSLGYPTAVPRSFVRTEGVASWIPAVSLEEVRNDWLQCDSLMFSEGTQSLAPAYVGIKARTNCPPNALGRCPIRARGLPCFIVTSDRPSSSTRRRSFPKGALASSAGTTMLSSESPVRLARLCSRFART